MGVDGPPTLSDLRRDVVNAVTVLLLLPRLAWRSAMQILSGLRDFAGDFQLDDVLPEWLLQLTVYAIPAALGSGDAEEQIEGAIILMGWSFFTGAFTGFVTVVFVVFWSFFLLIGIIRLSDAGDSAWGSLTGVTPGSMPGVEDGKYSTRRGDE